MTSTETSRDQDHLPIWAAPLVWLLAILFAARERLADLRRNRRRLDASTHWRQAIPHLLMSERAHLDWLQSDALALIASDPEFAAVRPLIARLALRDAAQALFPEPRSARALRLRLEVIGRSFLDPVAAVRGFARRLARAVSQPAPVFPSNAPPVIIDAPRAAFGPAYSRAVAWVWGKLRPP